MTISTTESRIEYAGNGATTDFSFPYLFFADGDLVVILVDSGGVETTLTLSTHYTISGAGDAGGGTVVMVTAPASGEELIIYRDPDIKQEVDYITGGAFPAETHEQALDRLTMIAQRIRSMVNRAALISEGITGFDPTLPTPTADKTIAFNATGTGFTLGPSASDVVNAEANATSAAADAAAAAASAAAAAASAASVDVSATGNNDWSGINRITSTGSLVFEGATEDAFETTIAVTDPTADRTATLPDKSGTIAMLDDISAGTDTKVNVSADDTTPGYLNGKLVAGTGLVLTEGTPGGDETLTIGPKTTGLATGTKNLAFMVGSHNSSTVYTKAGEIEMRQGGTINTYMRVRGDNNSKANQTGYGRIYVNGVAQGLERSSTDENWTSWYSEDITVSAGDLVQIYCKVNDITASSAKVQCYIRASSLELLPSSVDGLSHIPHTSNLDEL